MVIYIISDGKKGHLSQTRGLAAALLRRAQQLTGSAEHSCHEVTVSHMSFISKLFYKGKNLTYPPPDLILCAGHGTHLPALRLARRFRCPCMVCMKPSLPLRLFSLVIAPQHDFPAENASIPSNVFLTNGSLNAISPRPEVEKKETLLLIGGPSKEFGWDEDTLLTQLTSITRRNTRRMVLTTSRRTPTDFVPQLTAACPSIRIEPVETTGPTWVEDHLAGAAEVWVTQDSVSMVYEALSCGAPVGIIEMPKRAGKAPSRVARGLARLVEEGYVTTYTQWAKTDTLAEGVLLNEAERTANYILTQFPTILS